MDIGGKLNLDNKYKKAIDEKVKNYYVKKINIPYLGLSFDKSIFDRYFRLYIFFFILIILLILIMHEYVYEYEHIKFGGLNHFTLCENIPDDILQ